MHVPNHHNTASMKLIRGLHNLRPKHHGCVATMGAFDGMHRGHRKVLEQLITTAQQYQLPSTVIIFEPLPREHLNPKQAPARLMSFREKYLALKQLANKKPGIDQLLCIRFNEPLRAMTAQTFVQQILVNGLGIRAMIAGDDTHFGYHRSGDYDTLQMLGKQYGFEVQAASTLLIEGKRISSTRIRHALAAGNFTLAKQLLGKLYTLSGKVVTGQQLGRQWRIPTLNLPLRRLSTPLSGVYVVSITGLGKGTTHGVANIGIHPTINPLPQPMLEIHAFNFAGSAYGKRLTVTFHQKLRDEQTFASLAALQQQIEQDIRIGKQYFGLPI